MSLTQHITATVFLAGASEVEIDTYGSGGPGSHISVRTDGTMIWLYDQAAADVYAGMWLRYRADLARVLPGDRPMDPVWQSERYPVLAVHASGRDVAHATVGVRELRVRIGYVTWVCLDHPAYLAQGAAWEKVAQLAPLLLPPVAYRGK